MNKRTTTSLTENPVHRPRRKRVFANVEAKMPWNNEKSCLPVNRKTALSKRISNRSGLAFELLPVLVRFFQTLSFVLVPNADAVNLLVLQKQHDATIDHFEVGWVNRETLSHRDA